MKAVLKLEYLNEGLALWNHRKLNAPYVPFASRLRALKATEASKASRPWVANVDEQLRPSEFVKALWQRKNSNNNFTRGTELCFILESGRIYRAHDPNESQDYFCAVTEHGDVQRMTQSEARLWQSAASALMS